MFLCTPAKGVNTQGAAEKLIKVLDIVMEVGPANIGFYGHGSILTDISIDDVKNRFHDNSRIRCCFDEKEKLKEVLRRVKDEDLGLSITVSGLISEIKEISKELELKPHTINISCGVFGRVDHLPTKEVMEVSTMCGHGLISAKLIEEVINRLRKGEMKLDEAIHTLGGPCTCGIFNPSRARETLTAIVNEQVSDDRLK